MRNFLAVGAVWFFTVGFWGFMFPEFCFTGETVVKIDPVTGAESKFVPEEDFVELLNCEKGSIQVSFRLEELLR